MKTHIRPALMTLLLLSVMTGLIYPALITLTARLVFPVQAAGSLIRHDGHVVGSTLIGQPFDQPRYFWGRLSATGPFPYNAMASSGSNYGPLNEALAAAARARIEALRAADPGNTAPVPIDLVTASGSGLDPHITPAAALFQADRVARVRQIDPAKVRQLISRFTEPRFLGLFGESRVNVLRLNLALDNPS